jgi:hypothetical protein
MGSAQRERTRLGGAYLFYGYLGLVLAGALVIIGANYLGYDFLM